MERYTETLFGQEYARLDDWQVGLADLFATRYLDVDTALGPTLAALMRPGLGGRANLKIDIVKRMEDYVGRLDESKFYLLVNFIETYLRLTEEEEAEFRARLRARGERTVEATEMTWADEMMQRGREQGILQGTLEAKRGVVSRQVRARFGALPAQVEIRLSTADADTLDRLLDRVVLAGSVDEFLADL